MLEVGKTYLDDHENRIVIVAQLDPDIFYGHPEGNPVIVRAYRADGRTISGTFDPLIRPAPERLTVNIWASVIRGPDGKLKIANYSMVSDESLRQSEHDRPGFVGIMTLTGHFEA